MLPVSAVGIAAMTDVQCCYMLAVVSSMHNLFGAWLQGILVCLFHLAQTPSISLTNLQWRYETTCYTSTTVCFKVHQVVKPYITQLVAGHSVQTA